MPGVKMADTTEPLGALGVRVALPVLVMVYRTAPGIALTMPTCAVAVGPAQGAAGLQNIAGTCASILCEQKK